MRFLLALITLNFSTPFFSYANSTALEGTWMVGLTGKSEIFEFHQNYYYSFVNGQLVFTRTHVSPSTDVLNFLDIFKYEATYTAVQGKPETYALKLKSIYAETTAFTREWLNILKQDCNIIDLQIAVPALLSAGSCWQGDDVELFTEVRVEGEYIRFAEVKDGCGTTVNNICNIFDGNSLTFKKK